MRLLAIYSGQRSLGCGNKKPGSRYPSIDIPLQSEHKVFQAAEFWVENFDERILYLPKALEQATSCTNSSTVLTYPAQ
eukprot:4819398-Ditylum_brightwellii.AAC.1